MTATGPSGYPYHEVDWEGNLLGIRGQYGPGIPRKSPGSEAPSKTCAKCGCRVDWDEPDLCIQTLIEEASRDC
jgi:hypothetical protein